MNLRIPENLALYKCPNLSQGWLLLPVHQQEDEVRPLSELAPCLVSLLGLGSQGCDIINHDPPELSNVRTPQTPPLRKPYLEAMLSLQRPGLLGGGQQGLWAFWASQEHQSLGRTSSLRPLDVGAS